MKRTKKTELPKFDATEMRKDEQLSIQCLQLADNANGMDADGREISLSAEEVVKRATAFYNFAKGRLFLVAGETK